MAHIQNRGKDKHGQNRYRVRYRDPSNKERSQTFTRRKDAEQFAAKCELDRARGFWVDPAFGKRLFRDYATSWLAGRGGLSTRTRQKVNGHIENHLNPWFGDYRLNAVQAEDVREWLAGLEVAPSTANGIRGTLSQIFDTATRDGVLVRNPCEHVDRLAEGSPFNACFLTSEQVVILADAIDPRYRALIFLAAYSGLRWGELAALRTEDLDLLRGTVEVNRSMESAGESPVFKLPKSGKSRSVTIPRPVAQLLGEHVALYPGDVDAVFTSAKGGHLYHSNFYPRVFRVAVRRAGDIPEDFRFHDLRHTSVAIAIALGAHPKQIQARLGHSTIRLTLDRYGHLYPSLDGELQDRLDEAFSGALAASSRPAAPIAIRQNATQRPKEGR